ncbi:hypothetical protein N0V83_006713 [Neocucurbitaria cava]|uniref:Uncharacterized protein n=1 Tax=Neocucurbitaria cava TaxID=798079 RepID=A0A9W9CL89_9PLEO|nr:hypothetical protein N0V83_006713 [Neocucurbitaria cava]
MPSKSIKWLLSLATLPIASFSYQIDAGCGSDTDFVRSAIDNAFTAAAAGVSALTESPVNPQIDDVFKQLFGRNIADVSAQEQSMQTGFAALAAISGYNADVGAANSDVIFYCTTDRIKKRTAADGTSQYCE